MWKFIKKYFEGKTLAEFEADVAEIGLLEDEIKKLSNEELLLESQKLQKEVRENGVSLDDIRIRAFALVREAAKRTLGQRPYDVQLIGGLVLHKGMIAEMMTGEGKTLSAVAPVYLNALSGKGVHVVTVNEYLARRDAVWMGQIYKLLGLSVSCLVPNSAFAYDQDFKGNENVDNLEDRERDTTGSFLVQQEFLRPISRREAYLTDITYGTNHEFGFDYLRDNLAYNLESQVQNGHNFAIIDEVDSILIDEARTPLIISAPDEESSENYKVFARLSLGLQKDIDFTVDEKLRSVTITDSGIEKVERALGVDNLFSPENIRLVRYLEESLKAKALFHKDKEYVVKNGEVLIVDEFTGRILSGRRYNGGLHQAIEAKEGVVIKEESRTYAKISIQNYFRMYKKIAGMTGTAQTSAEEFFKVYNLDVVSIPPNKPVKRIDSPDKVYKNDAAKWRALIKDIGEKHKAGQPVLVGTTSISKNELVSELLRRAGIPHEVLNAKNNEREGAIIAQAGKRGSVTVATNMAGRGVDIILGGNPPSKEAAEKIRELGGLYVVGTERHEARRIDNQLKGRSGRQGDPGVSQFFLSFEDDLMRIFGGDRIKSLMDRFNLPEDEPVDLPMVSKAVAEAQAKVEGAHFDMRKHLLEYDDVLNKQREAVYKKRQELLGILNAENLEPMLASAAENFFNRLNSTPVEYGADPIWKKALVDSGVFKAEELTDDENEVKEKFVEKTKAYARHPLAKGQALGILDMLWMNHLEDLEAVSESIGLRAYGQRDPLVEYRGEAHKLYNEFWQNFDGWLVTNLFKLPPADKVGEVQSMPKQKAADSKQFSDVGRNDPCPCGAKHEDGRPMKYKQCHGKD